MHLAIRHRSRIKLLHFPDALLDDPHHRLRGEHTQPFPKTEQFPFQFKIRYHLDGKSGPPICCSDNLLRWMKHSTFKGTVLEQMGVGRLIHQGMQIPARVRKWGEKWIIEMPVQHTLVKQLLKSWNEISLAEVKT